MLRYFAFYKLMTFNNSVLPIVQTEAKQQSQVRLDVKPLDLVWTSLD